MQHRDIEQAIKDIRAGKLVIVADDEDRENEGDLIGAAEKVTPEMINFMAMHARGLICLTLTPERCQALGLPQMAETNTETRETAFTVSVDAAPQFGVIVRRALEYGFVRTKRVGHLQGCTYDGDLPSSLAERPTL